MVKECKYCGAEMDEKAVKCPECGKSVPNAEILLDNQRRQKKKVFTIVVGVIVCIALVVAVAIANSIYKKNKTGADSYIDAIDMNLAAMFNNDASSYLKSYPDFMRDMIEETLGSMTDDNFTEYIYELNDDIISTYGSDAAISYSVIETEQMDSDTTDDYLSEIFDYVTDYSIDDFPVQDAYQLSLEIVINGSVGTQTFYRTVAVMEFNNSWYLMNIINPINQQVDDQQG